MIIIRKPEPRLVNKITLDDDALFSLPKKKGRGKRRRELKYSRKNYKKNGVMCSYCGENFAESIDHVIPLSKGGSNKDKNKLPACRPCNSDKGSMMLEEFRDFISDECGYRIEFFFEQIDQFSG